MKPAYAFLDTDIARKKVGALLNLHSCLFCGHTSDIKITRLAKTMRGKIDAGLPSHNGTPIAPEATLGLPLPVAPHRALENVPPDNQQAVQKIGVQELPRRFAELGERMRAHEFVYIEIKANSRKDLVSSHSASDFVN